MLSASLNKPFPSFLPDACTEFCYHLETIAYKCTSKVVYNTGPDGAVVMSLANGLVGPGFASREPAPTQSGFLKAQWVGRFKATTPSSLSLTSNRVTTNY